MFRYFVKRILLAVVTVFIIIMITFFSMNAIPGGPFASEKAPSAAVQKVLEERYNLDKPVGEQFVLYLKNILRGDFGVSLKTGRPIATVISESFGISLKIGAAAAVVAVILGLIFGCLAALMRGTWVDRVIIFFTTLLVSVPSFVLGTLLLLIFCLKLKVFPVWSTQNPSYVLPVISVAMSPMAYITRLTKSSMLDVLGQDYIRTAVSKGVPRFKVVAKHALRNGLIPVITYVGPMVAYIITGSLVIETVFTTGGLGSKFVSGISNRDYPMIMATTIFLAILMVLATLISDLVYKVVDPRINFD